jgi:hypothetical protein
MSLHIYSAANQPATRFKIDVGGIKPFWRRCKRRTLMVCWNCRTQHRAENMVVQVYYDSIRPFCKVGTGCKARRKQ